MKPIAQLIVGVTASIAFATSVLAAPALGAAAVLGKAFEAALPFTALLVVFFVVVAGIHDQHLFEPVMRKGEQLFQGRIESLKRFQEDAREVASGFECGIQVDGFSDFEEGDEILTYHMEQVR